MGRGRQNLAHRTSFLGHPLVSLRPVTRVTADRYGRIASSLRRAGRPIPSNDIWIAAHALETGADLVTSDAHFEAVESLAVHAIE